MWYSFCSLTHIDLISHLCQQPSLLLLHEIFLCRCNCIMLRLRSKSNSNVVTPGSGSDVADRSLNIYCREKLGIHRVLKFAVQNINSICLLNFKIAELPIVICDQINNSVFVPATYSCSFAFLIIVKENKFQLCI